MNVEANKKTAVAFLAEFSGGKRDEAWARTTGDMVWMMMRRSLESTEVDQFTRNQYARMVNESDGMFPQGIAITPLSVTGDGNRVAIEATSTGPLANGTVYSNNYVFMFEFESGKIRCVKEYLDTAYARDSLFS